MSHGRWVGPLSLLDDLAADPAGPDGELFDRRGPEGVARRDETLFPSFWRRLASLAIDVVFRAVDSGDHHHRRPGRRLDPGRLGGEEVAATAA